MGIGPQELASKASQHIKNVGWYRGGLHDYDGRVCLVGGIYGAAREMGVRQPSRNPDVRRTLRALRRVIKEQYPDWYDGWEGNSPTRVVEIWNDNEERNVEEVHRVLEKVAVG